MEDFLLQNSTKYNQTIKSPDRLNPHHKRSESEPLNLSRVVKARSPSQGLISNAQKVGIKLYEDAFQRSIRKNNRIKKDQKINGPQRFNPNK